ncbi:MAG: hypothetical protein ABJF23_30405 [Bryobacteraceae bacterium]
MNLQHRDPFSPIVALTRSITPGQPPLAGTIYNSGSLLAFDRPDIVPGQSLYVSNPSPTQWLNPLAFVRHNLGLGNAGRNILTGPGLQDIDVALAKATTVKEFWCSSGPSLQPLQSPKLHAAPERIHGDHVRPDHRHPHHTRRPGQLTAISLGIKLIF